MEWFRLFLLLLMIIFMDSATLGQGITDIDRTKKKKVVRRETPSHRRVTSSTPSSKKVTRRIPSKHVFTISSNSATFGAEGGRKIFIIESTDEWYISNETSSWCHLTKNGNELSLFVEPNSDAMRRFDYFVLSSKDKTIRVDITQSGRDPVFSISSTTALFDESGGTKYFNVTGSNSWRIKTNPTTWGHLRRDGNSLFLQVDANPTSHIRTDYFEIYSGNTTIRVNISQSGETILSLSTQTLNFSSSGGTQTVNVSANVDWYIPLGTTFWGHLTKRGDKLLVTVDKNYSSEYRTDYFVIKAGNKSLQVSISQSGSNNTYSSRNISKRRQSQNGTINNDRYVKFGIGIMDIGIGTNGISLGSSDNLTLYYNLGISMKLGNYKTPVQFELGAKPGFCSISYDHFEDDSYGYGHSYKITDTKRYFHMPIYARLKFNICNVGNSMLYLAGIGTYNAIRNKLYENEFSVGGGLGFAWKKWDWFFYYKGDVEDKLQIDDEFIATSLSFYL